MASTEFEAAAEAQASALGFDPPVVFVPHPIQDRTDEEMGALADTVLEDILEALVKRDLLDFKG